MQTSDSDIESECFESAEESFDENEDKEEKNKFKDNLHESDSKTSKPFGETADSLCQVGKDNLNNSLSYRKRPEKFKSWSNKPTVKPISKTSPIETSVKSDKIVPDVFLQDITSNLSKNINKSLNTIQQTSSNVKDLILSSLPVSSKVSNESFSYDDRNDSTEYDDETQVLQAEENSLSEEPPKITNKDNVKNEKLDFQIEATTTETVFSETDSINDRSESPISFVLNKEDNSFQSAIVDENFGNEPSIIEKTDNLVNLDTECLDASCLASVAEGNPSAEVNVPKTEKNSLSEIYPSCENPEILSEQHDITEVLSDKGSVHCLEDAVKGNLKENSIEKEDKSSLKTSSENITILAEKNEVDPECNFDELKNALKNVVKEEKSLEEKSNESLAKEVSCLEDENAENECLNEGWDDFDFSDTEVESVEVSQQDKLLNKQLVQESKITENERLKSETSSVLNQNNLKKDLPNIKKPLGKISNATAKNENLNIQDKTQIKEETNKVSEFRETAENTTESDETWDWDNWDETPSGKNQAEMPSPENTDIKNLKKDDLDVSKWSGWDTFAQKSQEKQGTWGFGSWGVDALLNKATAVTQGISSVLEAGLGAPDPETLARMEAESRKARKQIEGDNEEYQMEISKKNSLTNVNIFPVSGLTNLVAGVTSKIVEHSKIQEIGSKVITGGLDTLETFGKKTMEVLQEGDPGLKHKRALLLGSNKPVLSQVLREAREKANLEMRKAEEKEWARKCHFETLFDDFQGMVHLEALEMVSRQCELKLDQIRSEKNSEEQEHLNELLEEIEQLCSLDECEIDLKSSMLDFKTALQMAVNPIKNEISVKKLIEIHEDVSSWLQKSSETKPSFTVIYQKLVSTLAELTAATVHQFHKGGELLSVAQCRMTLQEVDGLSSLTNILCKEINSLCEKFFLLTCNGNSAGNNNTNSVKGKITEVMQNSTSYIKQAFDLLIPIIQVGAVVS